MILATKIAVALSAFIVVNYSLNFVGYKALSRFYQKGWEEEFLRRHSEFIRKHPDNSSNDYVMLTIHNRSVENLLKLCRQYYGRLTVNRYINNLFERFDPKIETTNYVGFRRVKNPSNPKPVRAEIIRCNKTYGVIASDGERFNPLKNTAYSLTKAKHNDGVNGDVFYINLQFEVKEVIPHSEADQKNFENEFLTRNQDYLEQNIGNLQISTMSSNFDEEETRRFVTLCKTFGSLWMFVKKAEPGLEQIYLDFRHADSNPGPVRVEVIKCARKYAIMMAEKNVAIYLLMRGKYVENLKTKVFNIFSKIPYKNRNRILDPNLMMDDNTLASNSSDEESYHSEKPRGSQQVHHYP